VSAQLLDASLQPISEKPPAGRTDPKMILQPVELDQYPPEIEKLQGEETIAKAKAKYHEKFKQELFMSPKKGSGGDKWEGWFNRSVPVTAEKFPTGQWRVDVPIPDSTDSLRQKFLIRQSNPELDVTRPDVNALYQMASPVSDISVKDPGVNTRLQGFAATGADGKRLAFKFGDEEALKVIPECFIEDKKTGLNRGAVEDYWDKGIELPHWMTGWYSDKPMRIGLMLLVCVGLLSAEWLTRKLLKLA
jgi:hypothetical protein